MRIPRSLAILALAASVSAEDVLKTSGVSSCLPESEIKVDKVNIQFDRTSNTVIFDAAGSSAKAQNVTASLTAFAYGRQVYQKDFDPCDASTKVEQLCPVPAGNFAASGTQKIPDEYANMIPNIAFQVPDLDGNAKLQLKSKDSGKDLACIQSEVTNARTADVPAVSYVAYGVVGAALVMSAVSAAGAALTGSGGSSGYGPSFHAVLGWFQSMATNGMLSVNYPPVYRSFTKNFAFSTGIVPWTGMQRSIDSFRNVTGGNLTDDSVESLKNMNLIYPASASENKTKRSLEGISNSFILHIRDITADVNGTQAQVGGHDGKNTTAGGDKTDHFVSGVQGYVETLMVPQANTFMTVLLIFAIVLAAIAVGILLFKVILELWAMWGSFPKKLTGFRKRYWGLLARTCVNLILCMYGVWTLYCIFQFTHGDSWAAKLLAGLTLGIFTAVLVFFSVRIWLLARRYRRMQGDSTALYEDKKVWRRYSLFYDQYKKNLWWIFLPYIVYMFARGCVIAAGDGHGLAQTAAQLIIESLMLTLLLWNRPYMTRAGNWINIFIQVVRVLSVICILVFVEELGIATDTKTITGVALIAVQSALTGLLAILIAVNAIVVCVRKNPHKKEKNPEFNRDLDNLTPLDARNSLLMDPADPSLPANEKKGARISETPMGSKQSYTPLAQSREFSPPGHRRMSSEHLMGDAQPIGHARSGSHGSYAGGSVGHSGSGSYGSPPPLSREPQVPRMEYRGIAY